MTPLCNSGVRRHSVWIFLAFLVLVCRPLSAQSRAQSIVVLSLRDYGWLPPDRHEINSPSLAVDHQGRVLVGFTVRERPGLVTRSQPSLGFHIMRFSPDGKIDLSLSLATNAAGRTGIYLSDKDQIVARANNNVQLLQADNANPIEAGTWKVLAPCTSHCYVEQSVTRHTLLLYTEDADPPVTIIRLSEEPMLQRCGKAHKFIVSSQDMIQNIPQSITDVYAYFHGWEAGSGEFNYRWPICDYEHRAEMALGIRGRWMTLSDSLFVVNTDSSSKGNHGSGLEVISSDGQVKFRPEMEKHESAGSLWVPIRSSQRGDRIAVDMFTARGANQRLDLSGHLTARHIAIYDTEAGKQLASISVNPKHRYRFEFDLSPDGSRLAILEDDVLKVVELQPILTDGTRPLVNNPELDPTKHHHNIQEGHPPT
jgi:hypothetical protein